MNANRRFDIIFDTMKQVLRDEDNYRIEQVIEAKDNVENIVKEYVTNFRTLSNEEITDDIIEEMCEEINESLDEYNEILQAVGIDNNDIIKSIINKKEVVVQESFDSIKRMIDFINEIEIYDYEFNRDELTSDYLLKLGSNIKEKDLNEEEEDLILKAGRIFANKVINQENLSIKNNVGYGYDYSFIDQIMTLLEIE